MPLPVQVLRPQEGGCRCDTPCVCTGQSSDRGARPGGAEDSLGFAGRDDLTSKAATEGAHAMRKTGWDSSGSHSGFSGLGTMLLSPMAP